jgi:hypothetical protein
MYRKLSALLIAIALASTITYAKSGSSHSYHAPKAAKAPKAPKPPKVPKAEKGTHVRSYSRKDGTFVNSYDRGAANTGTSHSGSDISRSSSVITTPRLYRRNYFAEGVTPHPSVQYGRNGKIKRSGAAKDEFKRAHPCPANGRTSGSCPGYVIDHVSPLECGGADAPVNMQWQTVAEGKAKDKTERYCR